jgi:hypothetical protein
MSAPTLFSASIDALGKTITVVAAIDPTVSVAVSFFGQTQTVGITAAPTFVDSDGKVWTLASTSIDGLTTTWTRGA